MENEYGSHTKKSKRRWPWIVLGLFVLLLLAGRLSLKSNFMHEFVRNQLMQVSDEMLDANLHIGQVKGDLWKELVLTDVSLTRSDTVFSVDTLSVRYRLMSYFGSEFQVEQVKIDHPFVNVVQQKDGGLNLQNILKGASEPDDSTPVYFNIDQFLVNDGAVQANISSFAVDSSFSVNELNMEGGFGYRGDQYNLQLRQLRFHINQTRLPTVEVSTVAQATDQQITLKKLIIGTGRSVMESSALVNRADSTTSLDFSTEPLAWRDLSAYLDPFPLQQNLQMNLDLQGTFREFEIGLKVRADGLEEFSLRTGFRWDESLHLQEANLTIGLLDLSTLLADTSYPRAEEVQFSTSGSLDLSDFRDGSLKGTFSARNLQQGDYGIDQLSGNYSLSEDQLQVDTEINRGSERVAGNLKASRIWDDQPEFNAGLTARNIDPAYWLEDPSLDGTVNLTASLDGKGITPNGQQWNYDLDFRNTEIGGQQLAVASFTGKVSGNSFTTNSQIRLKESELKLQAQVQNYLDAPEYEYELDLNRLNLAECKGFEELPTAIHAHLEGKGKYITPEQLQLTSSVRIDSSIVNKEYIEELNADIQIRDTVAQINNGRLRSAIADGNFDARFHLLKWYDLQNSVDLNFQIKDLQTFAGLAGVETLQTEGKLSGQLKPVYNDDLQFSGSVDLNNLVFGETLTSERIKGSVKTLLLEETEYVFNLDLTNPTFNSVVLRDFTTTVRGKMAADSTSGDFQLMFSSPNENRIQHFGTYNISSERIHIRTRDLQVISDQRRLTLAKPFDVVVDHHSIRMDTLRLTSEDGAVMEAAIPHADSTSQRGYLMGDNLNMTVIQNTLLNESFFEGRLSGRIFIERQDTMLSSSGTLKIEELVYRGTAFDSLNLKYEVKNERLEGGLQLHHGEERLVRGELRVPFKIGDPKTFGSSFFEEDVFGLLEIREIAVSRFEQVLTNAGIANTTGLLRFNGHLRGTAGEPQMDATFRMRNAAVSGVAMDSVRATLDYNHSERELAMKASVMSLKQKAADIEAAVPIYLDLKDFSMKLPTQEDSIQVQVTTNQFNLASLNDFVDRTEIREVQGRLDGNVTLTGPLKQLSTDGQLTFQHGSIRIVEAGVKLSDIQSAIKFNGSEVRIQKVQAKSGSGTFTASGSIKFDELRPGAIDVKMMANNFRMANTTDYSASVNLDTRLSGTMRKPHLKGKLSFANGYIHLQNFGEKSVETVELDSAATSAYDYYVQYDSLSLDMDVSFNERFYVRNRRYLDLEYELGGQVDLLKKAGEDLQLFGTLEAVRGYSRPLGKRFQLEEGIIQFAGNPENPELNIRHIFEPPQQELGDIRIWYIIEGTVEDPQFRYESDPPMGLEDIISYTLFGKPFLSLEPWKQVVANSGSNATAANVAMDVLLDRVETLATQQLGIDVVQIENTRSGTSTGTSIKTGWYLNPKLFFAIQNEIVGSTPDTIFTLEYLLKRNFKLIITQGSDSQAGLDIRWNFDY